ncbi:MAG: Flp family type IVb pilin [Planctomycetota bacterium]
MYKNRMSIFKQTFMRFLVEQNGPSATEYAIMLALIVVGSMSIIQMLGEDFEVIYDNINDSIDEAAS